MNLDDATPSTSRVSSLGRQDTVGFFGAGGVESGVRPRTGSTAGGAEVVKSGLMGEDEYE